MDEPSFEQLYAASGPGYEGVPWATLAPRPELTAWLAGHPLPDGASALVVGSGLGDDAEGVAASMEGRRGRVHGFDVSPTAVRLCRERFPHTSVDYRVADLFDLPADWTGAFDLVVENRTLQSLPREQLAGGIATIAGLVRPAGVVWVYCATRPEDGPLTGRPWPLAPSELAGFERAGLERIAVTEYPPGRTRYPTAVSVYRRPS